MFAHWRNEQQRACRPVKQNVGFTEVSVELHSRESAQYLAKGISNQVHRKLMKAAQSSGNTR